MASSRPTSLCAITAVWAVLVAGCSESVAPVTQEPEPEPEPPAITIPVYAVSPPAGKLPWPQHAPDFNAAQYQRMIDDIWLINNFGLYQGGTDHNLIYLHDGLDIVLPNGTPIHAVKAGTVRANIGGNEFYRTLIIEDDDTPGYGWSYTHIYHFSVHPGDRVAQGTLLGRVNFQGVQHIHLMRVKLRAGGWWNVAGDLESIQPDAWFVYVDTEPPIFEGGFRYVRNLTDDAFLAAGADSVVTVSGDVDIVVGLRDPGEYARSPGPYGGPQPYGNRNAVSRVEYDIAGPDGVTHRFVAFDMSKTMLAFAFSATRVTQTRVLYQPYELVQPAAPPVGNNNARFSYYIITNSAGHEPTEVRLIDPADAAHAWRTTATGADGRRLFPDGDYVITVRAWDAAGNMASRSEAVRVAN